MLRRIITQNLVLAAKPFLCYSQTYKPSFFFSDERFVPNPFIEHYAETVIRSHRRLHLNKMVLAQTKNVLNATFRQRNEDVISLKQQGKCAGVIHRYSNKIEQQIDIVLQGKKMRKLWKSLNFGLQIFSVRVGGEQIKCIYEKVENHSDGFIVKAHFREFLPEKPNKLTIPLQITHLTENPYVQNSNEFNWKKKSVDIISYIEEYPLKFPVDVSFTCPERSYRIGDLANTFCPGIVLAPHENPRDKVFEVKRLSKIQKSMRKEMIKQLVEENKKKDKVAATGQAAGTPAGGAGGAGGAGAAGAAGGKK